MQLNAAPMLQATKAALKQAAGQLAEALAERDAAGEERGSIEAQLQAALKSVEGEQTSDSLSAYTVGMACSVSCHLVVVCLALAILPLALTRRLWRGPCITRRGARRARVMKWQWWQNSAKGAHAQKCKSVLVACDSRRLASLRLCCNASVTLTACLSCRHGERAGSQGRRGGQCPRAV